MLVLPLLLSTLALFDSPFDAQAGIRLEPLPDDIDYFLGQPMSFDIDASGHFYVLDGDAKTVFHWDDKGRFVGTIGTPGAGPGELSLAGRGRPWGMVAAVGEELYVFDGGKRKIIVFTQDGAFKREFELMATRSFVRSLFVVDVHQFLLLHTRRNEDERLTEAALINGEGKTERVLATVDENVFSMSGTSRETARFTLRAFNPTLTAAYNAMTGEALVGFGGEPSFDLYNLKTGAKKLVKIPMIRAEVTQADKDELAEERSQGGGGRRMGNRLTIEFPDKKPYYDQILPVGDRGFLVFTQSPYYRDIAGVFVDRDGNPKERFAMRCGQNGGILGARGRLLFASLDEEGDFQLAELKLK